MRIATLLLTLAFALGALAPCPFARAAAVQPSATAHASAHHATRAAAPPCHDAPAAVVKAPCTCGCDKRAPGVVSLGSLGVALLAHASELPLRPGSAGAVSAPPAAFASPPPAALEKVPRAA